MLNIQLIRFSDIESPVLTIERILMFTLSDKMYMPKKRLFI